MKILVVATLLLCSVCAFSQNSEIPLKEFTNSLSETSLTMKTTDSKTVTVTILKSKGYQKSKAVLNTSSKLPEGLLVSFAPAEGTFETSEATFNTSNVAPGQYTIIVNATVNYKKKGSILQLIVE